MQSKTQLCIFISVINQLDAQFFFTISWLITEINILRCTVSKMSQLCMYLNKAYVYVGQTSRNLKSRFREHTQYIKNSDPRSAYALHILNCRHGHGNIDDTMTFLKQINTATLLLPYEQMYIQSFYHNNKLIPEQHLNEHNPMFDLLHSQILHVVTHSMPNPQSHAFQPALSQPVHETATYRVSRF